MAQVNIDWGMPTANPFALQKPADVAGSFSQGYQTGQENAFQQEQRGWMRDQRNFEMEQRKAKTEAGQMYAAGDLQGAQKRLASAGDIQGAYTIDQHNFERASRSHEMLTKFAGAVSDAKTEAEYDAALDLAQQFGADVSKYRGGEGRDWTRGQRQIQVITNYERQKLKQQLEQAEATLATSRTQQYVNMTPAQRAQAAPTLGLAPDSAEYQAFVATGQFTPKSRFQTIKEGDTVIQLPEKSGDPARVVFGNQQSKADAKFTEQSAELQAKQFDEAVKQVPQAQVTLGRATTMRALSERIGDPNFKNTIAASQIGQALRAAGLPLDNMKDVEIWTAMVNQLVPAQRTPGSGTMSDRDVVLFKESLPMFSATKEGRDFVIKQMEAIAQYDMQRGLIANEAIAGRISRQQAYDRLMALPDPMELYRRATGGSAQQQAQDQQKPQRGGYLDKVTQPRAQTQPPTPTQGQSYTYQGKVYVFKGGNPANPASWEEKQ